MSSDFTLREAPTALCAQCGLPVRALGRTDEVRLCRPSCRFSRTVFGAPHGPQSQYLRLLIGGWAVLVSGASVFFLNVFDVGPEAAVPVLWAQALLFVLAFFCFGLPQWQGPPDEHAGLRHESVVVLACVAVGLEQLYRLSHDVPVSMFQPTLVLALVALGDWLDMEIRQQGAKSLGNLLDSPPTKVAVPGTAEYRPLAEVRAGEPFVVKAGESFAVESTVVEGKALLSLLRVSGSADPVTGGPGLFVAAGAVNLGQALTVKAARDGTAASWVQVHRGIHDLITTGRDRSTGVAGLFTGGDLWLLLLAAAVMFRLLYTGVPVPEAMTRFLCVLAAGGAGSYLATRDLAVALTARHLARSGVATRSLDALAEAAEQPVGGVELLPGLKPPASLKFLRDGKQDAGQWHDTVHACRQLMYNMQTSPWILLAWNTVGLALAAGGALSPGMAAGFALLGSVIHTHRALALAKTPERKLELTF